jgi:hypothetical protein
MAAEPCTSATNIDAALQFLDLICFSSSAGENGILEKPRLEEPEVDAFQDPPTLSGQTPLQST